MRITNIRHIYTYIHTHVIEHVNDQHVGLNIFIDRSQVTSKVLSYTVKSNDLSYMIIISK